MNLDELTSYDLFELLEQARHDLRTCKKNLAFKESLLTDLEFENAELSEVNERLENELKSLKRQEWRSTELDGVSDDGVDDGYGHWSHDEDDSPTHSPKKISVLETKLDTCSDCQANASEKDELFEQIEELHQQLEAVQKVNKLLQEDVTQKSAQIAELTETLLQKQAREELLEADLEFTMAEREIALRDLHDSQSSMLSSRRSSEEYFRSSSIGSSIGEELGLGKKEDSGDKTLNLGSFMDWEKFLAEPEAGPLSDSELAPRVSSPENFKGDVSSVLVLEKDAFTETTESVLDISLKCETEAKEADTHQEIPCSAAGNSANEWNDIQYSGHRSFGWLSLVCCGPTPGTPVRQRFVTSSRVKKEHAGFLSFLKRRIAKTN